MAITGRIGERYEIVSMLGAGGMGEVYRAIDRKMFDRTVAIKFLSERLTSSEEGRARFRREVQTATRLEHPNIVTIHDSGEHEGRDFFVMEFVDGQDLQGLLRAGLAWTLEERVDVAYQVADALDFAHRAGIVHRDIKPGNVMIVPSTSGPRAKLVDFGIARVEQSRLTQVNFIPGTFVYMSPEQLRGQPSDSRSDLFSLGIVYYELFVERHPFAAETEALTSSRILHEDPTPLGAQVGDLPADLASLILRMLDKDPARRPANAREVADRLREIARGAVARAAAGERAFSALDDLERHMVDGLVAWAQAKEREGALEDALAAYAKAARLDPQDERIQARIQELEGRVEKSHELDAVLRQAELKLEAQRADQARSLLLEARSLAPQDGRLARLETRIAELEAVPSEVRQRREFIAAKRAEVDSALDAGSIPDAVARLSEILRKYPDEKDAAVMLDRLVSLAVDRVPYAEYRAAVRDARARAAEGAVEAAAESCARARSLWSEGPELAALEAEIALAREEARRRAEEQEAARRREEQEQARREREVLEKYLDEARALLSDVRRIEPVSANESRRVVDALGKTVKVLDLMLAERPGHPAAENLRNEVMDQIAQLERDLATPAPVVEPRPARAKAAESVPRPPVERPAAKPESVEREPRRSRFAAVAAIGVLVIGLGAVAAWKLSSRAQEDPLAAKLSQVLLLPEGSRGEVETKLQRIMAVDSLLAQDDPRKTETGLHLGRLENLTEMYALVDRLERERDAGTPDAAKIAENLWELFRNYRSNLPADDPTAVRVENDFRDLRRDIESRAASLSR